MTGLLPEAFADLEPLVAEWSLKNQPERIARLDKIGIDELRAFYETMLPRMDAIIDHLERFPLDAMPEAEATLLRLALTFAETAHPIDLKWKTTRIESPFPAERLEMVGASTQW